MQSRFNVVHFPVIISLLRSKDVLRLYSLITFSQNDFEFWPTPSLGSSDIYNIDFLALTRFVKLVMVSVVVSHLKFVVVVVWRYHLCWL